MIPPSRKLFRKKRSLLNFALITNTRLIISIGAVLMLGQSASAATYYVSTSGSDSNSGSQSAPFRHLSKGAAVATNPGDIVVVMDGTYDNEGVVAPNYVVTLNYSGTPGNPITFMAQNRGQAILDSMNRPPHQLQWGFGVFQSLQCVLRRDPGICDSE